MPRPPVPSWLDPAAEVTHDDPHPAPREGFVRACVTALIALGCTEDQAAEVTANACNEAAWGRSFRAWNLGGWKITRAYALAHPHAGWWCAPGHRGSGDPLWCYYRAFGSLQEFFAAWLEHFVPKPGAAAPYPGYRACGAAFWAGRPWFPALIAVGYKGPVTKAHPEASIAEHASIVRTVLAMWRARPGAP